ncbi:MAG: glycosyltransferase [Moraxellaceae bacterium]|nr:glycosyltransferase [Moraxellaceae bacterium]
MKLITVKVVGRVLASDWLRYFPEEDGIWGGCRFIFDRDATAYDWVVVYDDVPPRHGQPTHAASEPLLCPPENTLLVTTEPSSIKSYGRHYTAQFGHVLTTQPEWALPHPHRHWQQAANHWYYGAGKTYMSRARVESGGGEKTGVISIMGSPKAQTHTLHAYRFRFIQRIKELIPEIEIIGRGHREVDDKAEAIDPFKYHVVLENHVSAHHITEKLPDAFLGRAFPFYAGAPNVSDYYPEGSYVEIDIKDPDGAAVIIRRALADDLYEKRFPLLEEARRRVLEEHHFFAVVSRIIESSEQGKTVESGRFLLSRHAMRRSSVIIAVAQVLEKIHARVCTYMEKLRNTEK